LAENTIETSRLLVVSTEPSVLRTLSSIVEFNSWELETAASGWDAMERVQSGTAHHLLLLDLVRDGHDSLHILRWVRRHRPDLPVIVLCESDDTAGGQEAIRLGAHETLVGPLDEPQLELVIRRHLSSVESGEADIASEDVVQLGGESFFVSASLVMQKLRTQAELLAQADVPVLILGERGSGKDTVARLIHKFSVRSGFKLLKVNCAAMPGDLLEGELFGTGRPSSAGRVSPGKFEVGEKGTVFLDEIVEMPAAVQAKLLQVLQTNEFLKPGNKDLVHADVRILAATSANLERALAEKKLREVLYYRWSACSVLVPPLRKRKDEIAILLRHLMHKTAKHYGLPAREFSSSVLESCQQHSWPGNLRELETFVKRYLIAGDVASDQMLTLSELELHSSEGNIETTPVFETQGLSAIQWDPREPASARSSSRESERQSLKSLVQSVKGEAERKAIAAALEKTRWNRKAAARLLEVSYRTLLYKIDRYHMSASDRFLSPPPVDRFLVPGNASKSNER
jgi:two-component system response regulator AtoC